jgi:hypothetical protein
MIFSEGSPVFSSPHIHGFLSNGLGYSFSLATHPSASTPFLSPSSLVGYKTASGWWVKALLSPLPVANSSSKTPASSPTQQSRDYSSWNHCLSYLMCGCQQGPRPITPTQPPPCSMNEDEKLKDREMDNIYLICYSRGRDVFNALIRGKDLAPHVIHNLEQETEVGRTST